MRTVSKAVVKAAMRSVGDETLEFWYKIEKRVIFVPLTHGSLAILLPSSDLVQIIGYAGTRKDYQECFDYAKSVADSVGAVPIFAIVFPDMLEHVSACGLSRVTGYTKDGKIGVCSESI